MAEKVFKLPELTGTMGLGMEYSEFVKFVESLKSLNPNTNYDDMWRVKTIKDFKVNKLCPIFKTWENFYNHLRKYLITKIFHLTVDIDDGESVINQFQSNAIQYHIGIQMVVKINRGFELEVMADGLNVDFSEKMLEPYFRISELDGPDDDMTISDEPSGLRITPLDSEYNFIKFSCSENIIISVLNNGDMFIMYTYDEGSNSKLENIVCDNCDVRLYKRIEDLIAIICRPKCSIYKLCSEYIVLDNGEMLRIFSEKIETIEIKIPIEPINLPHLPPLNTFGAHNPHIHVGVLPVLQNQQPLTKTLIKYIHKVIMFTKVHVLDQSPKYYKFSKTGKVFMLQGSDRIFDLTDDHEYKIPSPIGNVSKISDEFLLGDGKKFAVQNGDNVNLYSFVDGNLKYFWKFKGIIVAKYSKVSLITVHIPFENINSDGMIEIISHDGTKKNMHIDEFSLRHPINIRLSPFQNQRMMKLNWNKSVSTGTTEAKTCFIVEHV